MVSVRWNKDGRDRVKTIRDEQLGEYLSYGWIVVEPKQEPVEMPVPVVPEVAQTPIIPETPLQILEKAVDAVVDAPEAVAKRKAGRPKHRR
jgi:hypothetical protein